MSKVGNLEHDSNVQHKRRLIVTTYDEITQMPTEARVEGYHVYPDGYRSDPQAVIFSFTPGLGKRSIVDVEQLRPGAATQRKPFEDSLWQAWELADTSQDPAPPISNPVVPI